MAMEFLLKLIPRVNSYLNRQIVFRNKVHMLVVKKAQTAFARFSEYRNDALTANKMDAALSDIVHMIWTLVSTTQGAKFCLTD